MLGELPDGLHNFDEHIVSVDGGTNGGVIVVPFLRLDLEEYLLADASIAILVSEALHEIDEHLFLGHLPGNHVRMQLGVVHGSNPESLSYFMSAMSMYPLPSLSNFWKATSTIFWRGAFSSP